MIQDFTGRGLDRRQRVLKDTQIPRSPNTSDHEQRKEALVSTITKP